MKQKKPSPAAGKPAGKSEKPPRNAGTVKEPASAPLAERWVNQLIIRAIRERASDIHIEPTRGGLAVRFRIDGVLHKVVTQKALESAIVARIKTMSRMNLAEQRVPQDGRYGAIIDGREVDFRVSTFPATYGEAVVMRILDRIRLKPLDQLGFSPPVLKRVRDMLAKPNGVVLVTGPARSGKTTALYAILNELSRDELNIVTIEDPVEFDLDGVRQSQVNPRAGYTYPTGLAMVLRQDPDVIGLGGIRDAEIAAAAMRAALTGRRVFSTMHADDASETVTRLLEMGVEPFLVAKGLKGVIAQRLVRTICPACKTSYPADAKTCRMLGGAPSIGIYLKPGEKLFKGRGCAQCNNTGFQGQIGIFEVLPMTDELHDLVPTRPPWSAVNKLVRQAGVKTLVDDGIEKVKSGVTTIDEVLRATRKL
jgi:type II secretory ATPase GspE/PulE/Tfp pilus assembly ATPase PilB-like protein